MLGECASMDVIAMLTFVVHLPASRGCRVIAHDLSVART